MRPPTARRHQLRVTAGTNLRREGCTLGESKRISEVEHSSFMPIVLSLRGHKLCRINYAADSVMRAYTLCLQFKSVLQSDWCNRWIATVRVKPDPLPWVEGTGKPDYKHRQNVRN